MTYQTLITTGQLADQLTNPAWAVMDCRFALADPGLGERDYQHSHIPGAVYAHLDRDLAGPVIPGQTGRHPLPAVDNLVNTLSTWGIDSGTQVVAYDSSGGAMAARLWWLLRWLGHNAVAVLDGGWPRWQADGRPVDAAIGLRPPGRFTPRLRPELAVDTAQVDTLRVDSAYRLFDSRAADRYRGENETIDPVAGHIPGAISLPYAGNLGDDGMFLAPDTLKARFAAQLGQTPVERAVFYCGSGITAAHNVLAVAHAGLGEARLYAGSWSEWIANPARPIATGE